MQLMGEVDSLWRRKRINRWRPAVCAMKPKGRASLAPSPRSPEELPFPMLPWAL